MADDSAFASVVGGERQFQIVVEEAQQVAQIRWREPGRIVAHHNDRRWSDRDLRRKVDLRTFIAVHRRLLMMQSRFDQLVNRWRRNTRVGLLEEHLRVIEQFGRFPHRNSILGRESTPAELTYLGQAGAGF